MKEYQIIKQNHDAKVKEMGYTKRVMTFCELLRYSDERIETPLTRISPQDLTVLQMMDAYNTNPYNLTDE